MDKVRLGHTDEYVSELCLGTMYMGSKIDDKTSEALIEKYMDFGGTFIDTANNYAHWVPGFNGTESESFLGRWFTSAGKRAQVFLATKVGFDKKGIGRGLKYQQIIENCENSLKLMKTDYIDLYYAHTDDRSTPLEESMEAFYRLHRDGKIRFLGASNYTPWRFSDAQNICEKNGYLKFACLQNKFTYLRQTPCVMDRYHIVIDDDVMDFARDRELLLLAYSPLLQGFYTNTGRPVPGAYAGSFNEKRLEVLKSVAAEMGITLNRLVLAWMRAQSAEIAPIVSGSTVEQLEENLSALEVRIGLEQLEELNKA